MASPPRSAEERKRDALARLTSDAEDVWVSTASTDDDTGNARDYLVPLSLAWVDERAVIALETDSRTAKNLTTTGTARLAVGPTRDVVMIDAVLESTFAMKDLPAALGEAYAAQADWDPRAAGGDYVYLVLKPERIQAWREANELAGRTLMRDGAWIT